MVSRKEKFDERYKSCNTPWELDRPDSNLIRLIKKENIQPCTTLEIGCGTGRNALWLAQNKFDVTGIDFSPLAIEKAKKNAIEQGLDIRFQVKDFFDSERSENDFALIFDRGCFHSFGEKDDRIKFAENVNHCLKKGGLWFSLLGNIDDGPRDTGPPMRSAMDIVSAVEPYFEILSLISDLFDSNRENPARCWKCLMKKR